jgi:predicted metalloprotease with PDZ domain
MSKGCLDEYKDQYLNVYQKGALIGMCLDLKLLKLSGGKMNLQGLMRKLSTRFGKEKGFKDDELFGVITEMTYPEVGEFLNRHVGGPEPLPLQEVLGYAGIEFSKGGKKEVLDVGIDFNQVGYDEEKGQFYLMSDDGMSDVGKMFGFKTGDVLLKIQGKELTISSIVEILTGIYMNAKPSDELEYEIGRPNKKGKLKTMKLKGKIGTTTKEMDSGLAPMQNPSEEQLMIRKAWINQ